MATYDYRDVARALVHGKGVYLAGTSGALFLQEDGSLVNTRDQLAAPANTARASLYSDWLGAQDGFEPAGVSYYVDGNAGSDLNDGLSWNDAFKTLAVALAASHANIASSASGWAARNRVFIKGDSFEEDLTKLAQKTDIIGVGSCDHHPQARIIGNHVIGTTPYMGCRFINVAFKAPAEGGVIMTLPTEQSGISFIGCFFDGRSTTPATKAILATAVEQLSIIGNRFVGKYSTTTIDIGTGSSRALLIKDNIIESGAIGITVNSGLTCVDAVAMILDNVFDVVTLVIDENSDKVIVGGNRGRTQADGTVAATIDYNAVMAYDNVFAHSAGVSQYPVLVTIPT